MSNYYVVVEHSIVEDGASCVEVHAYEHPVANSDSGAWEVVRKKYARQGDTVTLCRAVRKCIPATHQDVEVAQ
jgi:hypothetical protein